MNSDLSKDQLKGLLAEAKIEPVVTQLLRWADRQEPKLGDKIRTLSDSFQNYTHKAKTNYIPAEHREQMELEMTMRLLQLIDQVVIPTLKVTKTSFSSRKPTRTYNAKKDWIPLLVFLGTVFFFLILYLVFYRS